MGIYVAHFNNLFGLYTADQRFKHCCKNSEIMFEKVFAGNGVRSLTTRPIHPNELFYLTFANFYCYEFDNLLFFSCKRSTQQASHDVFCCLLPGRVSIFTGFTPFSPVLTHLFCMFPVLTPTTYTIYC